MTALWLGKPTWAPVPRAALDAPAVVGVVLGQHAGGVCGGRGVIGGECVQSLLCLCLLSRWRG